MVTLTVRSCVARQEPYIPGALSILQGTVPGQVRGLGHMVPTYFRRELRDRALQRPSRLRTFVSNSIVVVMAGHSRPKDGVASASLCPPSTSFSGGGNRSWMPGTSPGMTVVNVEPSCIP